MDPSPLLSSPLEDVPVSRSQTPEEAKEKGDQNNVSLMIVKLVSKTTIPKVLAPFYAEFYGAMMLCLVIAITVGMDHKLAPLAIGSVLMTLVFTYGHLSGGHYNPAVSFAVMIRGKITPTTMVLYMLSQVAGGICGVMLGAAILPDGSTPRPGYGDNLAAAFAAEFIFTFALCNTVLNTATTVSVGENSFYGLAIGFTVLAGAVAAGDASGAVFNPAVGTGLLLVAGHPADLWLYWLAPLCGGLAAGVMFHLVNSDEDDIDFDKVGETNIEGAPEGAYFS